MYCRYTNTVPLASVRLLMLEGTSSSHRAPRRWSSKPQHIVRKGNWYVGFAKNRVSLYFPCIQFFQWSATWGLAPCTRVDENLHVNLRVLSLTRHLTAFWDFSNTESKLKGISHTCQNNRNIVFPEKHWTCSSSQHQWEWCTFHVCLE